MKGAAGTSLGTLSMVGGPASTLRVLDIPSPYAAGSSSPITVIATSAAGNLSASYRGAVKVTSTDTAATLPADYTFTAADNGVKQLGGLTLRTAGSRTVTVTDKTTASITGSQTGINVVSPSPASMTVAGIGGTGTAGTARSVTVTVKDAQGNTATGFRGTVSFTSTDTKAELPVDYTFTAADNGVHTFSGGVTLKTAGTHSVTAASNGLPSASQSGIVVTAAALDAITVTPASATAQPDVWQMFETTARDAYGNSLGDVTEATTLTPPNGLVQCADRYCRTTLAGKHIITATYNSRTATAELIIPIGAPAQMSMGWEGSNGIPADGASQVRVWVRVYDQYGNVVPDADVRFSTSGDMIWTVRKGEHGLTYADVTASLTPGIEWITATVGSMTKSIDILERPYVAASSISPSSRGQGANGGAYGQSITINGASFTPGTTVDFGFGVTNKFTTVHDSTRLTAHVVVADWAPVGTRDVVVTTPAGAKATLKGAFTVNAGPKAYSVSSNSLVPGMVKTITVSGSGFDASTKVTFPQGGVAATKVTLIDSTTLSVEVSTAKAAITGPRDLVVTNADQGRGTLAGWLMVTGPGMSITGMDPAVLGPGALRMVTLSGSGFVDGAKVSFAGTGVAPYSVVYADATRLNVLVSVAGNATPGARKVTVTNPDGTKVSAESVLSVSAGPTVTAVAPDALRRGTTQTVTVTGTGFQSGASLAVSSWVLVSNVDVVDDTTITATVTVPATTALGTRNVTVINPDGGKGAAAVLTIGAAQI